MDNSGWISLHRKITDNFLYPKNREFTKFEAWIDLLLLVNHEKNDVLIKNEVYVCERGQSVRSLESYQKRWNWTQQQVRSFFELLKKQSMIETKGTTKTTILTILKYDSYQNVQQTDNKRITNKKQTNNKRITTNNNENNDNNKYISNEKKIIEPELFPEMVVEKPKAIPYSQMPKLTLEQAKQHYENVLKSLNGELKTEIGIRFIDFIDIMFNNPRKNQNFGNALNRPYHNILSFQEQLTFIQYQSLQAFADKYDVSLVKTVEALETWKDVKKRSCLYSTLNDWLESRRKK